MIQEFSYDVFLSHSSEDMPLVRELAERLRRDNLRVWLDEWEIKPGDMIPLKIEQGLEQSRTLVLVMSENAFASDWVTLERHTVLFRDPANEQRRFIPLRLDNAEIPDILRQFLYIDWREQSEDQYAKLLAASVGEQERLEEPVIEPLAVLRGHTDAVYAVAVTPDGKKVASGSEDETLKIWDLDSGQYLTTPKGHTGTIYNATVTPDGKKVVSGSQDRTLRIWDLDSGQCLATLEGHTESVFTVAVTPDGKKIVSGSVDNTLKIWDLDSGQCLATLEGHTESVLGVAVTPDGKKIVSGSRDKTLRTWDLDSGQCLATLEGHTRSVYSLAVTSDGKKIVSGSYDNTLRIWDLDSGQYLAILEGHTRTVRSLAITPDGKKVVSGSDDKALRIWDLDSGQCLTIFKGHTGGVNSIAVTPDGKKAISGADDKTIRIWDIEEWDEASKFTESTSYSNAKVVLVGESGVGKTGLLLRICEDRWVPTESTHGMQVSRLELPGDDDRLAGLEREVWLWDFAGQPDYRLIHQLYMDETALGILVFDPQDDNPFEAMGHWNRALQAATKYDPAKLLVAARCDRGGITISNRQIQSFIKDHGFSGFLNTGAKTGDGCEELKEAIAQHIPWDRIPWTVTTRLFKTLKDAIITLTEDEAPLVRLPELRQRLQLMLPNETIGEADLRAVVGLMQGQGVIQALDFGDFVLLSPKEINRYASVVVRMAREQVDEMGSVPERQVLDGRLDYKDMERLNGEDEKILLRAIVKRFLDRSLCFTEETPKGTMLVFPSYFRRDKPDLIEHPNVFVTYNFSGLLDEIYATLVVRLSYSGVFTKDQLWKNAADFNTPGGLRVGLSMTDKGEGSAEILVYFEAGVPDDIKVTFIKYVHEHLLVHAQPPEEVTRVRTYVCPHCQEPMENHRAIEIRLTKGLKDILCPVCEKRLPLIDLIEEKFASSEFLSKVREMDEKASINLDNQSRELILVGHAIAITAEAGQIFRPVAWADWGIDGEIEFKDYQGKASGKRVYLQLKSGDSYLYQRKRDRQEIFTIKNPRHAKYWVSQAYDVMLVIRTSDGKIRWMNVTEHLKKHGTETKQIIFEGEPFTAPNLVKFRDSLF